MGFAFATPASAFVNQVLRHRVVDIYNEQAGEVNIFTHCDLGDLLPPIVRMRMQMTREEEGKPSTTLRMAREAVAFARKYRMTEIRVVAAKPHMWRCLRDIAKAMEEAKINLPIIREDFERMSWFAWFHKSSTQPRTRSPWAWLQRDVLLWLMPWKMYKRIAS